MKICSTLILLLISTSISAQNYKGFSGGMMLHTGYLQSKNFTISSNSTEYNNNHIKSAPFGIGGLLRFHFGSETDQVRVGMEGYRSAANYKPLDSNVSIGWGGLFVDYIRHFKGRVDPFVGVNFGGGGVKNLIVLDGDNTNYTAENNATYRRYPFIAITPFVGIEIEITKKLRFIFKADYLFNINNRQNDFPEGPRFYAGIIFYRMKEKASHQ